MSTLKAFETWLNKNKPKSVTSYISGYKAINRLISKHKLGTISQDMNLKDFELLYNKLTAIPEFIEMNKKGNNMYSDTMLHFKSFLSDKISNSSFPNITNPFPSFGWKWATTGIVSYLNEPQYLKPVLDAILINGNGKDNYTRDFKELIHKIGDNKYNLSDTDKISKLSNSDPKKNIIENSASYWYNLGLLSKTGRYAEVSDLGIEYLKGKISDIDFVYSIIENYQLPSNVYTKAETEEFRKYNIVIHPLKLLYEIILLLDQHDCDKYLTVEDLSRIIVPLSFSYDTTNIDIFVKHIIAARKDSQSRTILPEYLGEYNDDKGLRMLNEYLYFLECYDILSSSTTNVMAVDKKYFLNKQTLKNKGIAIPKYESKGFNKIYYGPPGTGKSHSIIELLESKEIDREHYTRVTFHPDYDYASFIGSYKPNMYTDNSSNDNTEANSSKIQYSFVPQVFTKMYLKAWAKPYEDFYLIIEEINRGNCAEIFGDVFQLLDRNPEYDIEPSQELLSYINKQNPKSLINGKMRMPSNLYIIASMNTSDQSLFPMDSAFKRRWEWEYVKIDYKCTKSDFVINLRDNIFYSWLEFLEEINKIIFDTTKSEDKQIGNWFLKGEIAGKGNKVHRKGIISRESFINKVVFYLWNDVFKDEMNDLFKNKEGFDVNLSHFFQSEEEDLLETFLRNNLNLTPINEDNIFASQS